MEIRAHLGAEFHRLQYTNESNEKMFRILTEEGLDSDAVTEREERDNQKKARRARLVQPNQGLVSRLLQFLENHKLLNFIDRPQWRTVKGGSREYVNRIVDSLGSEKGGRIHLNSRITGLRRGQGGVILSIAGEGEVWFDKVVMAAHADQSLALISDATELERDIRN